MGKPAVLLHRQWKRAKALKKRTPTNLYNERPTWLALAHRRLDEAVLSSFSR